MLVEFGVPVKLVRLIKIYLRETYSKFGKGKYPFDNFPIQNGPKQRDALSPVLFNFASEEECMKVIGGETRRRPLGRPRRRWVNE
jgi:hypothetical protein